MVVIFWQKGKWFGDDRFTTACKCLLNSLSEQCFICCIEMPVRVINFMYNCVHIKLWKSFNGRALYSKLIKFDSPTPLKFTYERSGHYVHPEKCRSGQALSIINLFKGDFG